MKRHGCLTVSMVVSGSGNLGSSPGQGQCDVLLGKTLYSNGVSLHPGVLMDTDKNNAGGNSAMDYYPI